MSWKHQRDCEVEEGGTLPWVKPDFATITNVNDHVRVS